MMAASPSTSSSTTLNSRFDLTTAQRLLWLGQKLVPESPLYNMAFLFTLGGKVDAGHFQAAFQAVVDRSDTLRTVIDEASGTAKQQVLPPFDFRLLVLDFSAQENPVAAARDWAEVRVRSPFDLSQCLFDTALIYLGQNRTVWYLNQHHLITDISSVKQLVETVGEFYARSLSGTLQTANPLTPYAALDLPTPSTRCIDYWRACELQPVALYHRSAETISARTRRVHCEIDEKRTAALKELSMHSSAAALTPALSLFNLVAGLLFAYLYRVSVQGQGRQQLAIATPAHGRPTKALKETLGVFIELFPLLSEIEESETFSSLLAKVREASGALLRHAEPGASEFAPSRDVNVVLNFIPAQLSDFAGMSVRSEWIHAGAGDPRHHLRLQVHDFDGRGRLQLHFDLNEDLFERELQDRVPTHFLALVDAVLADPEQLISSVDLLGDEERSQLAALGSCKPVNADVTVVESFEQTVQQNASVTAVICGAESLTYEQLNAQVNRLASYLRSQGVSTEIPVGICLRRSTEMLIAVLAVLKAGGAYVPIEPSHPVERISYILEDMQIGWVLTHSALTDRLIGKAQLIALDAIELSHWSDTDLDSSPQPQNLAYLLYTSGSTGQPKGVAVEHRNLANYVQWAISKYVRGRQLSFPLFSPLAFDLTVTSIFVPLLSGGQVVVYPDSDEPLDLSLQRIVQENAVDVIKLTPSHLALIQGMRLGSRLKTLILGGEDLKSALASAIASSSQQPLEIYNEYGPTEATVGCMIHSFDSEDKAASVPIGQPAAGSEIYLLDKALNRVPLGAVGEIFIGGPGLARGYFNRDELTAERFVDWRGKRLYRTGDLGRWRESDRWQESVLLYLGRGDRQVKIRGHRVELGEIEAAVAAHPRVSASAVSVVHPVQVEPPVSLSYCTRCGLASNYPGVSFDAAGVCDVCRAYETYKNRTEQYFREMDGLRCRLETARAKKTGDYDCMMLLSGGKDSTYALAQLVQMGLKVFAFTLDNGYISDGAKENIRRVVEALTVDHVFGTTPAMNEIFVDSLERHCNVCNGCFKTIYTLSMKMAYDMGIPVIVTGLSRGQFFETRLSEEWFTELFGQPEFNPDTIDETVLEARKVYHRSDDAVSQLMDVEVFQSDDIFEAIEIVDFYRYCDVRLAEMMAFLRDRLPWIRPADTGRSTNCLINNAGIYVHTQQRGYHNYALPYSWDVRMGHKTVDECIDELNDEINVSEVKQILKEIGYDAQRTTEAQLAAYYCAADELSAAELRTFLSQRLPSNLVPAYFVPVEQMPLTKNGKVDYAALPAPQTRRSELQADYVAPQTATEKLLVKLWRQVLKVDRIGIHDNFFDLGGDSIMAIQIAARLSEAGFGLSPNQIFQYSTIAELVTVMMRESSLEPEDLTGNVPLTPIQQTFFELESPEPEQFTQTVLLTVSESLNFDSLRAAVKALVDYHASLRLSYQLWKGQWRQRYQQTVEAEQVSWVNLSDAAVAEEAVGDAIASLQTQLNLADGDLLRVALFDLGDVQQLGIVIHHLAVDAVSWLTLLKDLETLYRQINEGEDIALPPKTSSFKAWAEGLTKVDLDAQEKAYWENLFSLEESEEEAEHHHSGAIFEQDNSTGNVTRQLDKPATQAFLQDSNRDRPQEKLLAALTLAATQLFDCSSIRLDMEGHGREDALVPGARLVRTVGWFTSLFPVVLTAEPDSASTLRAVKKTLRSIPQHGIGYGILRYFGDEETQTKLREQPESKILFNYLGDLEQLLPAGSMFSLVAPLRVSRSALQQRSHPIDISAFILDGQLQIDWCYSGVKAETVEKLADDMMAQLQLLGAGPTEAPIAEDFPLANLDSQKMDKLSTLLGQLDGLED